MDSSDVIASVSAAFSAIAIAIGVFHEQQRRRDSSREREDDLSLAAEARVRAHVLELLVTAKDGGLRTVDALGDGEEAESRLPYLRRTATQLEVVGEAELAASLTSLCREWAEGGPAREQRRQEFVDQVKARLRPPR